MLADSRCRGNGRTGVVSHLVHRTRLIFSVSTEPHRGVDRLVTDAADNARRAREMQAGMDRLRVEGQSPDGKVSVVLDHSGSLVDVRFEPDSVSGGHQELRHSLLAANRAAQGRLSAAVTAVVGEHFGRDSDTTREFHDRYVEQFGEIDDPDQPGTGNGSGRGV